MGQTHEDVARLKGLRCVVLVRAEVARPRRCVHARALRSRPARPRPSPVAPVTRVDGPARACTCTDGVYTPSLCWATLPHSHKSTRVAARPQQQRQSSDSTQRPSTLAKQARD